MFLIAIFSLLSCIFIGLQLRRISKDGFLNMFYIFFYCIELFISMLLILFDSDYRLYNGIKLTDLLSVFSIASVVACCGVFLGQYYSNKIFGRYKSVSINDRVDYLIKRYSIDTVSNFFLLLFSFTIITSLDIAYFISVIALSFSFTTAFIGLIWTRLSKTNKFLWVLALVINFAFHAVQGSRGTAMFPIIFLIIGYLISIKRDKPKFRKSIMSYAVVAIIVMPILALIADFREVYGRGLEVNADNIQLLWNVGKNISSSSNAEEKGLRSSLGRMLIQANPSVVYMTPDKVPYRYEAYMIEEMISVFSLKGEEGRDVHRGNRANIGYGTGVATKYGFAVTEETSVEFPIFADGFSRFGFLGLFLYSIFFAIFLSFLEKKVLKIWIKNPLLSMTLTLFILYNGVLSYMYSYYSFLKIIIFKMTLVYIITYLISIIASRKKNSNKQIKYENCYNRIR